MTSAIDISKPTRRRATTASVRANFSTIKTEIEALQVPGRTSCNVRESNSADANTAALLAAIATGAGVIEIGAGDYSFTSNAIDVNESGVFTEKAFNPSVPDIANGVILVGQGQYQTRLHFDGAGTALRFYGKAANNLFSAGLRDLSIMGPALMPVQKLSGTQIQNSSNVVLCTDTSGLAAGMWVFDIKNGDVTKGDPGYIPVGAYIGTITPNVSFTLVKQPNGSAINATGADGSANILCYTDSCGIQAGGVSAIGSNIVGNFELRGVGIWDFFTGLRTDDSSGLVVDRSCNIKGCSYGIEGWYNNNVWDISCAIAGEKQNGNYTATLNSSTNITAIATGKAGITANFIPPGSYISEITTPSTGALFPANTKVLQVTSSTSVTTNNAATGSGAGKTVSFYKGVGVALGKGPWRPNFNASTGTTVGVTFRIGCFFGALAVAVDTVDGTAGINFEKGVYCEQLYQLAVLGGLDGSGNAVLDCDQMHLSSAQTLQGLGVIYVPCAGTPGARITWRRGDNNGTLLRPLVTLASASSGSIIVDIDNPALSYNSAWNVFKDGVWPQMSPAQIGHGRFALGMGNTAPSAVCQQSLTGTTGQFIPKGYAKYEWTLTGNTTLSTFASNTWGVADLAGQVITIVLIQDGSGGRSFTFPADFVNSDGNTRVGSTGVISSGTANQKLQLVFVADQARQKFIRTDGDLVTWT